jgi:hypothetical protein
MAALKLCRLAITASCPGLPSPYAQLSEQMGLWDGGGLAGGRMLIGPWHRPCCNLPLRRSLTEPQLTDPTQQLGAVKGAGVTG